MRGFFALWFLILLASCSSVPPAEKAVLLVCKKAALAHSLFLRANDFPGGFTRKPPTDLNRREAFFYVSDAADAAGRHIKILAQAIENSVYNVKIYTEQGDAFRPGFGDYADTDKVGLDFIVDLATGEAIKEGALK